MFNCNDVLICLIWLIKIGYINGGLGSNMEYERDVKVLYNEMILIYHLYHIIIGVYSGEDT